jgi:hypothetical protein
MTSSSKSSSVSESSHFVTFVRFFTLGFFLSAAAVAFVMVFSH